MSIASDGANRGSVGLLRECLFAQGYGLAIVVSLVLHGVLLFFLLKQWTATEAIQTVPPNVIRASVVKLPEPEKRVPKKSAVSPSQKKKQVEAERRKKELERERRVKAERERKKKEAEALRVRQEQEALAAKKEQERVEREREARAREEEELKKQREAEERRQREQDAQLAEEQAEQDAAEVALYSDLLRELAGDSWNRPPSARNGMTALVQLTLTPMGDLVEIKVLESSGNEAFDRSVIQAVRLAAPFKELRKVERRLFDQHFRRLNLKFRPEDLVR